MDFQPKCEASCPIVIETRQNIEAYMAKKDAAAHFADAHLEDVATETQEFAARHPDVPDQAISMIGRVLRARTAHKLNHFDTLIRRGEKLLGKLAAGCEDSDGPLTFRATKGDTTYTATACTSKNVPKRGKHEQPEPVYLTRAPRG